MNSLEHIRENIISGNVSLLSTVEQYIDRIQATSDLNIYVEVYDKEARERAKELDQKLAENPDSIGKLFGVVASIKDVLCYKNHHVTASSKMLEGFESQFTATAIQAALDEDMIIIGRTNCDEFAMGSSNEHSAYGPTKNGADPMRVPGGSSGAAAVSVQMDTCQLAFGSDTGGSVRQPAGFCGVYGMKPTYGRISRYGLIAYASSFDQIGLLSKDIDMIQLALSIVEGYDPMDSTSIKINAQPTLPKQGRYKFAYFSEALNHDSLAPSIKSGITSKINDLKSTGHSVEEISFSLLDYLVPCYYVLTTAEASSNLNRYDGLRYGLQNSQNANLKDLYVENRSEGFGLEVKRRIMMGTFVLSVGYFDAYYNKAQKVRRLINQQISEYFKTFDFILMPTTPDIAWTMGSNLDDPVSVYLSDIYTVLANICGLPAISIPLGESEDMPFGYQLIGPKLSDEHLLHAASVI